MPRLLTLLILTTVALSTSASAQVLPDGTPCAFDTCALRLERQGWLFKRTDLYRDDERLNNPLLAGTMSGPIPIRLAVAGSPDAARHALRYERLERTGMWPSLAAAFFLSLAVPHSRDVDDGLRTVAFAGYIGMGFLASSIATKRGNALRDAVDAYNATLSR